MRRSFAIGLISLIGLTVFSVQWARVAAPVPAPVLKAFNDGDFWVVMEPIVYIPMGMSDADAITVPAGFVTDLASIPAPARAIFKNMGKHGRAAIVHDYLYWSQGCTREEADNILNLAMFENQVSRLDREAIYEAVNRGGASAWRGNQQMRAAGGIKILPEDARKFDALMTWPVMQDAMKKRGLQPEPPVSPRPNYCSAKLPDNVR